MCGAPGDLSACCFWPFIIIRLLLVIVRHISINSSNSSAIVSFYVLIIFSWGGRLRCQEGTKADVSTRQEYSSWRETRHWESRDRAAAEGFVCVHRAHCARNLRRAAIKVATCRVEHITENESCRDQIQNSVKSSFTLHSNVSRTLSKCMHTATAICPSCTRQKSACSKYKSPHQRIALIIAFLVLQRRRKARVTNCRAVKFRIFPLLSLLEYL